MESPANAMADLKFCANTGGNYRGGGIEDDDITPRTAILA